MSNLKVVKETRVNEFITWSRNASPQWLKEHGNSGVNDHAQIAYGAWQLLMHKVRRSPTHQYDNDFDAAAAEHYSYIRYLAASTGDPYCHLAPTMYAAKKVFDQLRGKLQDGKTDKSHPVLPANPYIVAWGIPLHTTPAPVSLHAK
jgi:hypothetical protein